MGGPARRLAVVLAIAASAFAAVPAFADASPSTFVAMLSDSGDYIGGGNPRLFQPANATIAITGNPGYLTVHIDGDGHWFYMDFAAAPGQTLHSGYYVHAQRAAFRETGHPGIDIFGDGRGCNTIDGLFEVKDIGISGNAVTRLWIVYEQRCEGSRFALFGELKIGEPPSSDSALVAPRTIRWPAGDVGVRSTSVPVWITALDKPVTLTSTMIVGGPGFTVDNDECSGHTLAVGQSCRVFVSYLPTQTGVRSATLRVTGPGAMRDVALDAFAFGGRSRGDLISEPGDYIGDGQPWHFSFANGDIGGLGSPTLVSLGAGGQGIYFNGLFAAPAGEVLEQGVTYLGATRYPFNGSGPGMNVTSTGRGCNTLTGRFTVNSLAFWPDDKLRYANISFVQHCEGLAPALRGVFSFRAKDETPLPPWMGGPPPPPVRSWLRSHR